jgi:hypothetical protein
VSRSGAYISRSRQETPAETWDLVPGSHDSPSNVGNGANWRWCLKLSDVYSHLLLAHFLARCLFDTFLSEVSARLHLSSSASYMIRSTIACPLSTSFLRNRTTTEFDHLAFTESARVLLHSRKENIPLIHSLSALAKKATTRPISCGTATLFSGQRFASPASMASTDQLGVPPGT